MAFNPSLNNQPHTPYKRRMPSVARVVEYWRTHPPNVDENETIFVSNT